MAYLQAVPLLIWRSPWSSFLLVTALNTAAIWLVYQATAKVLGRNIGLLAALLFAINPWVVSFSRMPWTQGLLPFFMAVIAWGVWPTRSGRS
jgi:4-amino-4-deoxy-L-arabinose transferase-like glycosyltransferase